MDAASAIEFILRHQNKDGGFGYHPAGRSYAEPTGFCAIALISGGHEQPAHQALAFLKHCLQQDGAVGLDPLDSEGNWMAYAALLAFFVGGAASEAHRVTDWILGFRDASARFSVTDLAAIRAAYCFDASIPGWPWTLGTSGWVEPTALFLIALLRCGVARSNPRIKQGIALLIDRKLPGGGWNFGNPYSGPHKLEPNLLSTNIALAALAAAGLGESEPAIKAGIQFVRRSLQESCSTVSLCWGSLALRAYASGRTLSTLINGRLSNMQESNGGCHNNLFETALAFLVSAHPGTLILIEEER